MHFSKYKYLLDIIVDHIQLNLKFFYISIFQNSKFHLNLSKISKVIKKVSTHFQSNSVILKLNILKQFALNCSEKRQMCE